MMAGKLPIVKGGRDPGSAPLQKVLTAVLRRYSPVFAALISRKDGANWLVQSQFLGLGGNRCATILKLRTNVSICATTTEDFVTSCESPQFMRVSR
jgi:hypothetical protein